MSAPTESQIVAGPDLAPVLVGLLRREGAGLLQQRGRLNGLLRDYAPGAIRDIRLLLAAYDSGVPHRLGQVAEPTETRLVAQEADRLVDEFGCAHPLALNAVSTWGRAFAGLRVPAAPERPKSAGPVHFIQSQQQATAPAADAQRDEPGGMGRWGGIALGLFLVLVALARWLGWM